MEKIKPIKLKDNFYIDKNFVFNHKVYWYNFVIEDVENRYFKTIRLDSLIRDLKYNNSFFVFDHSMDYVAQSVFHILLRDLGILRIFEDNDIPLDRLIVITPVYSNIFYQTSVIYDYVYLNKKTFDNKKYYHIFYNSLLGQAKNSIPCYPVKNYLKAINYDVKPSKHFMTLARRDSLNRRFINYLIHKNNLFEKGYISHQRVVENNIMKAKSEYQNEIRMLASREDFNIESFLEFGFKKHFLQDTLSKEFSAANYSFYRKCSSTVCFDLVSETDVHNNFFITEKVLKPIIHGKPFMVSGSAYSLEFLRKVGFQTYESLFDESYDKELVFYDRIGIIFENMKYLCNLPLKDCYKKVQAVKEITVYNQKHFLESAWTFGVDVKIQKRINEVLNV